MNTREIVKKRLEDREILKKYLVEKGFDGLYFEDECSCGLDHLADCCDDWEDCEPGYKIPCHCGDNCAFHIGPKNEKRSLILISSIENEKSCCNLKTGVVCQNIRVGQFDSKWSCALCKTKLEEDDDDLPLRCKECLELNEGLSFGIIG
jgi:hypothetical protein